MLVMVLALAVIAVPALVLTGCGSARVPSPSQLADQEAAAMVESIMDGLPANPTPAQARVAFNNAKEDLLDDLGIDDVAERIAASAELIVALNASDATVASMQAAFTAFAAGLLLEVFEELGSVANGTYRFNLIETIIFEFRSDVRWELANASDQMRTSAEPTPAQLREAMRTAANWLVQSSAWVVEEFDIPTSAVNLNAWRTSFNTAINAATTVEALWNEADTRVYTIATQYRNAVRTHVRPMYDAKTSVRIVIDGNRITLRNFNELLESEFIEGGSGSEYGSEGEMAYITPSNAVVATSEGMSFPSSASARFRMNMEGRLMFEFDAPERPDRADFNTWSAYFDALDEWFESLTPTQFLLVNLDGEISLVDGKLVMVDGGGVFVR